MQTLKIDLVSDVVCPWCAIGDARLGQALRLLEGEVGVETEWHPFVLNPDLPAEGRPMLEHLSAKYGRSEAQIQASQHELVAAAEACGLNFARATERRSWNTFDTHRVLCWAKEAGLDAAFNRALFEAYFGEAKDPTDAGVLRATAEGLGLDGAEVDAILESDRYAETVRSEIDHYHALGVSGVPAFIVEGRYLISGAQPPDVLADSLRQIASEAAGAT